MTRIAALSQLECSLLHSVSKRGLLQAVELIKGVLSVYDLGCKWMFTCGQQAYADYLQVHTWL